MSKERMTEAGEFAKEHWPKVLAATTAGAAVILLIKFYLNKKKEGSLDEEAYLNPLLGEAEAIGDSMAVILETGETAMNLIPESAKLAEELGSATDDPELSDHMDVLSNLSKQKS